MFNLPLETKVWLATEVRIWALAVAAVLAFISFAATWAQTRWQVELSEQKAQEAARLQRESDERIATAQAEGARANERAAILEVETTQAKRDLEKERTARLRIEAGLASRHVTAAQLTVIVSLLKEANMSVHLSRYSDSESTAYANEIAMALQSAGVTVAPGSTIIAASGNSRGLFIEDDADPRLIDAFKQAQIPFGLMPSTRNDMIGTGQKLNVIFVGLKPSPF